MDSVESVVLPALARTIKQETYEFEHYLVARQDNGISMVTRGYVDLAVPLVAAEMIMDVMPETNDDVVRMWTFYSDHTIYQCTSVEDDTWVTMDSHGIGATAAAPLYWLYGSRDCTKDDRPGRYRAVIDFDRVFRAAPAAQSQSLRQGLHETRTDLLSASAEATFDINDAGLIGYLEIVLPAYHGPDPTLDQPESLITLALTRTARRTVRLPETDTHTTPEAFMKELLDRDRADDE